ncbi:response regulator transcription factor [bacterium]|nr:response regulator transcription factor [bacterium]
MKNLITVSLVEDDLDICSSLAKLINNTNVFTCIHQYHDCQSGVEGIVKDPPNIVLMDIGLPDRSGIEGISEIRAKLPDLNIIVLTAHENDDYVFNALCAGASGYIIKEASTERILGAIHEVLNGGAPMSTQIARMVVKSFQRKNTTTLSPREMEVLNELCTGKSYKMIADVLFISEETVRRHLKSIYKKLHVSSKSEAVAKALKERLI